MGRAATSHAANPPLHGVPRGLAFETREPQPPRIEIVLSKFHALFASVRITNCGSAAMRVKSARAAAPGWRRPDSEPFQPAASSRRERKTLAQDEP